MVTQRAPALRDAHLPARPGVRAPRGAAQLPQRHRRHAEVRRRLLRPRRRDAAHDRPPLRRPAHETAARAARLRCRRRRLSGCGADEPRRASAARAPAPLPTAVPEPDGELGRPTTRAGHREHLRRRPRAPARPGGGGPGVLPPRWFIPGAGARSSRSPASPAGSARSTRARPTAPRATASARPTSRPTAASRASCTGATACSWSACSSPTSSSSTARRRGSTSRSASTFRTLAPRIGQTFLIGGKLSVTVELEKAERG